MQQDRRDARDLDREEEAYFASQDDDEDAGKEDTSPGPLSTATTSDAGDGVASTTPFDTSPRPPAGEPLRELPSQPVQHDKDQGDVKHMIPNGALAGLMMYADDEDADGEEDSDTALLSQLGPDPSNHLEAEAEQTCPVSESNFAASDEQKVLHLLDIPAVDGVHLQHSPQQMPAWQKREYLECTDSEVSPTWESPKTEPDNTPDKTKQSKQESPDSQIHRKRAFEECADADESLSLKSPKTESNTSPHNASQ